MKYRTVAINLFYLLAVFLLALLAKPTQGEGWFWESGNALGFIAFACLLILCVNGRSHKGHSIIHRYVGIAVLVVTLIHALWFLLGEPLIIDYLKLGTPPHMVAGLSAFILIGLLSLTSLKAFRNNTYTSINSFRVLHRYLTIATMLLCALHIILSGYYFTNKIQITFFLMLSASVVIVKPLSCTSNISAVSEGIILLTSSLLVMFLFVTLRGM